MFHWFYRRQTVPANVVQRTAHLGGFFLFFSELGFRAEIGIISIVHLSPGINIDLVMA